MPRNLHSSPNCGSPRQRTSHVALVGWFLLSKSIDLSFSKNVANPFEAIFGSLTMSPFASTARGRSPNCPASRRPAVSSIRKLCSRKKPHATSAYADLKSGQRNAAKPAITKIVPIGSHADGETGKKSARIIPSIAVSAKPTNGWRPVIGKFTLRRFGDLSSGFASQRSLR